MRSIVGKRSLCAFKNQFAKSISSVVPKSDVQVKDFQIKNEPILGYLPGSEERKEVEASLSNIKSCLMTTAKKVAKFYYATPELINKAIETSLEAKKEWGRIPIQDRIDLFMKVSDQMSKEYRGDLNATTMLGQSKTIIQAEIDSACEIIDFFFDLIPPFLPSILRLLLEILAYTPSIMGNGTVWKPSDTAILSNHLIYEIFKKAGFPDGLVNFVPSDGLTFGKTITASPNLAAVNFTGSVPTFQWLWKAVGENISNYTGFPKLVGECGGKNYHFVHPSAEVETVVKSTIRSAFEYQGQKCSACSRVYAPKSLWPKIKEGLIETQKSLKVGDVQEFDTFMSAVIDRKSFDRNKSYIDHAKSGTQYSDHSRFSKKKYLGPIVSVFVYDDKDAAKYVQEIGTHTPYALTGAIYCQEEDFAQEAARILRHTAGNFYVNDKSTGSVVGQQPFGGDRLSGTNDKAGGPHYMLKWASAQSIKQTFVPLHDVEYPYMKRRTGADTQHYRMQAPCCYTGIDSSSLSTAFPRSVHPSSRSDLRPDSVKTVKLDQEGEN
ncbi:E1.2.1.88 [Lepeophtheirus salmonis]|uniref:L-glutamate gamma-semialdehyde dehydrogenase n=1 Tax=Lepeophtheirus salmonis TaxID=72036 RepID=A0A7R8H9E7_LEPSM|nr:E1.2.1.88 [Lepeophtheirus salmonis]CAF2957410.1 E1.2.1.88 [Lepeophtheirus salmonis]